MPRLSSVVLTVMTATVAMTACGDGAERQASARPSASASASAMSTPTDAAFIAEAEAVCAGYLERLPNPPTSIGEAPAWFDDTEANISQALEKFRAIDYPKDATGEGVRRVLVAELGGSLSDLRSIRADFDEAVRNRDQAAASAVAERLDAFGATPPDREGVLASAGLTTCDEAFGPGAG